MRRTTFQLLVSLGTTLVMLPAAQGYARLWRVERDGSGDYATIQPAIDAAAPADTIQLGPGRYTETTATSFPGFTVRSHAVVEKGPLTFLARVPGETIIGPTVRNDVGFGPHGMSISATAPGIRIEGFVIENVFDGIFTMRTFIAKHCAFSGSFHGISAGNADNLDIDRCLFEKNDGGISVYDSRDVRVSHSTLTANIYHGIVFGGCINALVDSCTIVGPGAGVSCSQGSWGRVERSTISSSARPAVDVAIDASASIIASQLLAGTWTLAVRARSSVYVSTSVIRGGQFASVYLSGGSTGNIERSHILKGQGLAAEAQSYPDDATTYLNLTGNYWGTASRDSVAAWIHDGLDDPTIKAVIDFDPILLHPVPSAQSSVGSLKAKFR